MPVVNGDEDVLEQDDMYERVPDTFRQQITSFSHQAEAPKLPPMHTRSRKPSDDPITLQHRASSAATLPSSLPPSSPQMRARLYSSPSAKSPPSYTAPSIPPPPFPAPNPPTDDDEDDALYDLPGLTTNRTMSNPQLREKDWIGESQKKASTLPVKPMHSYGGPPAVLGPLPRLPENPNSYSKLQSLDQPEKKLRETEDPGYDTTQPVSNDPNYDRLEPSRFTMHTRTHTHTQHTHTHNR